MAKKQLRTYDPPPHSGDGPGEGYGLPTLEEYDGYQAEIDRLSAACREETGDELEDERRFKAYSRAVEVFYVRRADDARDLIKAVDELRLYAAALESRLPAEVVDEVKVRELERRRLAINERRAGGLR